MNNFEYQKNILYISSFLKILESIYSKKKTSSRSVFKDYIIVKFVLKLFQTYKIPDYFLYLCNVIDVKLHRVFGHLSPKYNEHTYRCGH